MFDKGSPTGEMAAESSENLAGLPEIYRQVPAMLSSAKDPDVVKRGRELVEINPTKGEHHEKVRKTAHHFTGLRDVGDQFKQ